MIKSISHCILEEALGRDTVRLAFVAIATISLIYTLSACTPPPPVTNLTANLHQGNFATTPTSVPDSLTVVSYNIAFALEIDAALNDLTRDPSRQNPDVLLLQEMDTAGVEKIARALALNYVYWPSYVHGRHARTFGVAVLSRWPIVDQKVVLMPHPDPATGHQRKAVAADLQIGPHRIRAVSVHLSTMIISQSKRLDQATVVLDSLCAVDYPVIVGGDFNSATSYEATLFHQLMRKDRFRLARLPAGPTAKGRLFGRVGPAQVLDHIFYRDFPGHGTTGRLDDILGSDHFPIWAHLACPR